MPMHLLVLSDFNAENLAGFLRNLPGNDSREVRTAPFGQIHQVILDKDSACWTPMPNFCIVWTRPESVLPSFRALLEGQEPLLATILAEVDAFAELLKIAKDRAHTLLVPTWVLAPNHVGRGLADLATPNGPVRALMAANLRLLDAISALSGIHCLSAPGWIEAAGANAFSPRLWYGAKVPFGTDVFRAAAWEILSAIRALQGRARKLILLDLDDTLWGGTVGDLGSASLVLGGHDPIGEALVDFQKNLHALSRRGVALGILSKNDELIALDAIARHPEMVLRPSDFAGWRINWNDKAQNLAELVQELRLGLDSVVFLDDNPVERARIREAYPEVLVPDLPEDKRLYSSLLLSLGCFSQTVVTEEDKKRTTMYAQERQRHETLGPLASIEEWLEKLEMRVTVTALNSENISRVAQLFNKTNQMNLSTRRASEAELLSWHATPNQEIIAFRVEDRFGDSGLTGVLGLHSDGKRTIINDFVLSCRVMGRRVEETMLHVAVDWARDAGCSEVIAHYLPTARNKPCYDFFLRSGFSPLPQYAFLWDAHFVYPRVKAIQLNRS